MYLLLSDPLLVLSIVYYLCNFVYCSARCLCKCLNVSGRAYILLLLGSVSKLQSSESFEVLFAPPGDICRYIKAGVIDNGTHIRNICSVVVLVRTY